MPFIKGKERWSKKDEYRYLQGALVKKPFTENSHKEFLDEDVHDKFLQVQRTAREKREIAEAMKAPRGHVPKREVYNHPHKVDTVDEDIGKFSKENYWVHRQKSWGLKGRKMRW